jgi:hypothetical protein
MKKHVPLLAGIVGLTAGFLIPRPSGSDSAPPVAETKASERREASAKKGLSRLEQLTGMAAELSRSEWPAFFAARLHSPQETRLAARLWAEADPGGFWAWLRESRDRDHLDRFSGDLLLLWSVQNPEAAMAAVMTVTDKSLSDRLRKKVIDAVLDQDFDLGIAFVARAGTFDGFSSGTTSWIAANPGRAASKLAGLPAHNAYRFYLDDAVREWARQDPAGCLDWLAETPPPEDEAWRAGPVSKGFKSVALSLPGEALDAALQIADSAHRSQALAGVISSGKLTPEEILPFLEQVRLKDMFSLPGELGGFGLEGNFSNRARILDLLPANMNSHNGYRRIAAEWSEQEPAAAWEWAASISDPVQGRVALAAVIGHVGASQLDAIAALPFGVLSDDLLRQAAAKLPADQREAWLARMPPDRAAWARRIAAVP